MLSIEGEMNYDTVLEDLESRLRAGQAQFEVWESEKAELLKAIEAIRNIVSRQHGSTRQITLPGGSDVPPWPDRRHRRTRPPGGRLRVIP